MAATTAIAGTASSTQMASPSRSDEKLIMNSFENNGMTVKPEMKAKFLETIFANSTKDLSDDDWSAQDWVKYVRDVSACCTALGPIGAPLTLFGTVLDLLDEVRAQYEADNISARYLSGIVTAQSLAAESVKIIAAVQEVTQRTMSDHELAGLEADSSAIQEFLGQEISPFIAEIGRRRDTNPASCLGLLRSKRTEVKTKREQHRRSVQLYMRNVEMGLSNMTKETYSIHTNQLPCYAAACALEVLLMGYYCMLGEFDYEDFMLAHDKEILGSMVADKSASVQKLYQRYMSDRQALVFKTVESDSSLWLESKCRVYDGGAADDIFCPKMSMKEYVGNITLNSNTSGRLKSDGSYKFSSDSMSGNDYAAAAADKLIQNIRTAVESTLELGGLVWRQNLSRQLENMELVLQVVERRETRLSGTMEEARKLLTAV